MSSSSVETPLSSQVGNIVLIDVFNVFSRVLSIVLFLRASWCFPDKKKTRSILSPDTGQPWYRHHILTTSGYVWCTLWWVYPDRPPQLKKWGCTSRDRPGETIIVTMNVKVNFEDDTFSIDCTLILFLLQKSEQRTRPHPPHTHGNHSHMNSSTTQVLWFLSTRSRASFWATNRLSCMFCTHPSVSEVFRFPQF